MDLIRKYPIPSLVVAVVAIVLLAFKFLAADKPPEFVQRGLSIFMERQIEQAELLSSALTGGSQIVVLDLDRVRLGFDKRSNKKVIETLQQHGSSLLHFEVLTADESRGWDRSKPGFPYAEYLRVAEAYPEADAIISLCGLPYFGNTSDLPDLADLPKLLTTSGLTNDENAEALFHQGWLYAVTVAREEKSGDDISWVYELLVSQ